MLDIKKIDHVGIRVHQKERAIKFYENLGFEQKWEGEFEKGHPIIMEHPCGVVINILGPANQESSPNILMDVPEKYAGYTHMALKVESLDEAEKFMNKSNIKITEKLNFGEYQSLFIRDPDGNVIEFN